jgi:hypothetical protein
MKRIWSFPRPGRRARHLEGDADGLEKTVLRTSANAIPLLVDQGLTITMIATTRGWDVPRPTEHARVPLRLVVAGAMPDCVPDPQMLVTAEGRGVGRPDPGWYRHSRRRPWPGAVSLGAAEPPWLVVSAAAPFPYSVFERSVWIFSPSCHSCAEIRGPGPVLERTRRASR